MKFTVKALSVIVTLIISQTRALKFLKLDVPSSADKFSPVTLRCEYDLEGQNLYSVKWYKDGSEFFRYMPDYDPQSQAVKTSGISVDLQKSGKNHVTIINLKFKNSGNYKCEVSTEGPNFETVARNSNMTVIAYPREDPVIDGVLTAYSKGDIVTANCTSGKSNPQANMNWYINGIKAIREVRQYKGEIDRKDSNDLYTKMLGLYFEIPPSYFTSTRHPPVLELLCTSIVGESVRQKSVNATLVRTLSNKFSQERDINDAGAVSSSKVVITLSLIIFSLQMVIFS